jgi:hypothetical protein
MLSVVMLSVVMLSVVMLSVVILSVVMLSAVTPEICLSESKQPNLLCRTVIYNSKKFYDIGLDPEAG